MKHLGVLLFVLALVGGCTFAPEEKTSPAKTLSPFVAPAPSIASPTPFTKVDVTSCPVTLPNGKSPGVGASDFNLGNEDGTLFTIPSRDGVVIFASDGPGFILPDDSLSMKWPWFRNKVKGTLTIGGKRLDGPAPPPRADVPCCYGETGFQPIELIFPTEGCWEITGKVGDAQLTFVTLVVKVSWKFISINWLPEGYISETRDLSDLPQSFREVYQYSKGELSLESTQGKWQDSAAWPEAAQEQVLVKGAPGICVQGLPDEEGRWQSTADGGVLEWTADGASYRIRHKGLGLTCKDLQSMVKPPS